MKISCIILAAGSSTRMSNYKQLLKFRGKSFIKYLLEKIAPLDFENIFCVTGLLDIELRDELKDYDLQFIHNANHLSGQTSSLKQAIARAQGTSADAAMIVLTDQPLIRSDHYARLMQMCRSNTGSIIATEYSDTFGVPAMFPRLYFQNILDLDDAASAKSILKQNQNNLLLIECEDASRDIDTDDDYKNLITQYE